MSTRTTSTSFDCIAAANAAAIIALLWFLFCRFFYIPFPEITVQIFQSWFPALQLNFLWSDQLLGNFLLGVVTFPLAVWISVFGFGKIYNYFSLGGN